MSNILPHSNTFLIQKDFDFIKNTFYTGITTANAKVNLFKKEFQNYVQKEYIELYSSGTSALYELLLALNIKKNDEVLLPSYICESVKKAIMKCEAIPIFYDNEKGSWISSYSQILKKVNKNIKTKNMYLNGNFFIKPAEFLYFIKNIIDKKKKKML